MLKTSLHYFITVARKGSIRAASAELNVAQSAVSRQLQALEREIGSALLERRPRGVVLTPAGTLLLGFGLDAVSDRQALVSGIGALRELRAGDVAVAAIEAMVPNVLPRALRAFRAAYPAIPFSVEVATTDQVAARVREGEADIGVGFCPALTADLTLVHRSPEPLFAIMAPSHPLASFRQVALRDVMGFPLALSPADNPARSIFAQACRGAGLAPAAAFESNSLELLRRFTESGDGISILLRHTVTTSLERGRLVAIPFAEAVAGFIDVFTARRRHLPAAPARFAEALVEALRPA